MNAGELMNELYERGIYRDHKIAEHEMKLIKEELSNRFEDDENRKTFLNGVVAKFQHYKMYETNHVGLNDYLNDVGLLIKCANFDKSDLLKNNIVLASELIPFEKESERYIKLNPNKLGRIEKPSIEGLQERSSYELSSMWLKQKKIFNETRNQIDDYKQMMFKCKEFQSTKKANSDFGSISLLENKPTYDMEKVYEAFGADVVVQNAKVNLGTLQGEFIENGFISWEEVNRFRTVVGYQTRFIMIAIEAEVRQLNFSLARKVKASLARDRVSREMRQFTNCQAM